VWCTLISDPADHHTLNPMEYWVHATLLLGVAAQAVAFISSSARWVQRPKLGENLRSCVRYCVGGWVGVWVGGWVNGNQFVDGSSCQLWIWKSAFWMDIRCGWYSAVQSRRHSQLTIDSEQCVVEVELHPLNSSMGHRTLTSMNRSHVS
jgi:hypothetical protein